MKMWDALVRKSNILLQTEKTEFYSQICRKQASRLVSVIQNPFIKNRENNRPVSSIYSYVKSKLGVNSVWRHLWARRVDAMSKAHPLESKKFMDKKLLKLNGGQHV